MKKIVVLGAGLVGKTIATDLSRAYDVTSVDKNEAALSAIAGKGITPIQADVRDPARLKEILAPFDLVVGAVPGFMGFETVRHAVASGKNMVDISFFPEDPFELDELAKKNNVSVIVDCGVAPGMGNIILGFLNGQMRIDSYECHVGGLPFEREWPYEYRAVFSPIDVIEEYIRPARFVQNGKLVVKAALSDPELIHFDPVGTLESWNSDGLRTLIRTMPHIPNMIEKTLRYPGCIEYLRVLRESGFFSSEPVEVNGISVRPIDVTSKLLFPRWNLKPGEEEFTAMRIRISGEQNGKPKEYVYHLFDRTDKKTGTLSMARTTGYTCSAVTNILLKGIYDRKGISPPEFIGSNPNHFKFILGYLADRGVNYVVEG